MATRVIPDPNTPGLFCIEQIRGLQLIPSPLRPDCPADQRIFLWRGVHKPSSPTLDIPIITHLADLASRASLEDSSGYGSGLRKFHIFCDIFSIPDADRLPASFPLLNSFVIWAVTEPDTNDPVMADGTLFETISTRTARKYLSAVRAWHLAQGWPPPLSDQDQDRMDWSLRGMAKIQGAKRKRPPRPPATKDMLQALKATLSLSDPFDACIWAMVCCAFFGLMRFGEVSVTSRAAFNGAKHLKRSDAIITTDRNGHPYAHLRLPAAKTAGPGETLDIFLVAETGLCPLKALTNLASIIPALPTDPLFSWRDQNGQVRPMVRIAALTRINSILSSRGWGNAFGHSFRIGGASFYLAAGVSPEIVRLQGRWKSLAYEAYIRAFEQIASVHLANLA